MSVPSVSLVLHEPDSVRVLRAALEAQARLYHASARYHAETAPLRAKANDPAAARDHKRQANEYQRRAALAQALVDQLPTT